MRTTQRRRTCGVQVCLDLTESWKAAPKREGFFPPISCRITQVAFPVSSLPSGPGSCNYYSRDLEGCLLPRHGLLLSLPPSPTLFSCWPRLRRAALSQQLDSCVQSETTYNSRRFKGGNFGVKCCSAPLAPALSSREPAARIVLAALPGLPPEGAGAPLGARPTCPPAG